MKVHYSDVSGSILQIKKNKRLECFNWGSDNAYPSLVEVLIRMSVTSKNCVDLASKAMFGGAFGEKGKEVVNSSGHTLNKVLRIAGREYAKHNNIFLHVSYNLDLEIKAITVMSCRHVRVGKSDSKGYSGKFLVYKNWDKSQGGKIMSSEFVVCDRYTDNKQALGSQVAKVGSIEEFNGHILHIKKDDTEVYSMSDMETVKGEALTEYNGQEFRCNGIDSGFLNTKVAVTQPFEDDDEREEFRGTLDGLRSPKNTGGILHLEMDSKMEDLTKQVCVEDLTSKPDDAIFKYSEDRAEKNICKAFTVPLSLISSVESSSFSNSGEEMRQAKIFLWESKEEERGQLEEAFGGLMARFKDPIEGLEILNPYEEKKEETKEKEV